MSIHNIIAGLLVGLIIGLTGIGGGSLMAPVLILIFGTSTFTAIGTDLWFAAITKLVGSWVHIRRSAVDWVILKKLTTGSLPGAIATLFLMQLINIDRISDDTIISCIGIVVLFTALSIIFTDKYLKIDLDDNHRETTDISKAQGYLTLVIGLFLGIFVTMTSIGAGTVGAVLLLLLFPGRFSATRLVGTDTVHAIPLAVTAGIGYLAMGLVDFSLLFSLLIGSVPGVLGGARLAHALPTRHLRLAVASTLGIVGVRMFL